ncbi:sigma-54-dependent transcriptional regulator [Thaumasiovibrio subtropicus]|uniref:sigma-54-dependent transcriptional regulator n=1 Tax=Thaumasiovibrio subtropicus TaxID=1891207 RepID=UPI000B34BEDE|nr:sigma-54 dependent transcriptional regulator [Thaumasiovibrio subtropicus]
MNQDRYPSFGILLIDDEAAFLRSMSITLERNGFNHIYTCQDERDAHAMLRSLPIGLVLLDLTMPYHSGREMLSTITQEFPDVGVIMLSGLNQVETAVECIQEGAFDYFVKTTEESRLIAGIRRAIQMLELRVENQAMRQRFFDDKLQFPEAFRHIITDDKGMHSIFRYLESISPSRQPVLICGESGSGKELIARAIHELSHVKGPLISVNAAGLDDNVFADTLFGHKRGAYTGADQARSGMIEKADGGTLFLDEIGDLSMASQVKLLRLLQEGEYYPLGSDTPKRMNARIVVATHQRLNEKMEHGEFRRDLYYRLKTHQVDVPPLRNRKGDISLLVRHFIHIAALEMDKPVPTVPKELSLLLENYHFPGNVRELRALAYDAVGRHRSKMLSLEVFKQVFDQAPAITATMSTHNLFSACEHLPTLQEASELLVDEAMSRSKGSQSIAAKLLGISQPALSKRLKKRDT